MCFDSADDDEPPSSCIDSPEGAKFIACGGSGFLYAYPNNDDEIMKICSSDPESKRNMNIEKNVYSRFSKTEGHPNILKCHRIVDNGVYLERAKHGDLREYYRIGGMATMQERLKWSHDIASALHFVHENQVKHGDLCGKNVLLNAERDIKLCDFAGSGVDGRPPTVCAEAGYAHPDERQVRRATIRAELHALGSTIYEIITSLRPHEEEQCDAAIIDCFRDGIYPEVDQIPFGYVILKCWKGEYNSAEEVAADIKFEDEEHISKFSRRQHTGICSPM